MKRTRVVNGGALVRDSALAPLSRRVSSVIGYFRTGIRSASAQASVALLLRRVLFEYFGRSEFVLGAKNLFCPESQAARCIVVRGNAEPSWAIQHEDDPVMRMETGEAGFDLIAPATFVNGSKVAVTYYNTALLWKGFSVDHSNATKKCTIKTDKETTTVLKISNSGSNGNRAASAFRIFLLGRDGLSIPMVTFDLKAKTL